MSNRKGRRDEQPYLKRFFFAEPDNQFWLRNPHGYTPATMAHYLELAAADAREFDRVMDKKETASRLDSVQRMRASGH